MKLIEEPSQKPTAVLCGYHDEYKYVEFAEAECPACGAEYLAWCGGVHCYMGYDRDHRQAKRKQFQAISQGSGGYECLSFRSTFDDEPGESDMPKRKACQVWADDTDKIVAELREEPEDGQDQEKANAD